MEDWGHLVDLVDQMERLALDLESRKAGEDPTLLHQVFQGAHNLKSGLAMADLPRASKLIHTVEDGMDRIRRGKAFWSPEWADFFLWAVDGVRHALQRQTDLDSNEEDVPDFLDIPAKTAAGSPQEEPKKPENQEPNRPQVSEIWGILMSQDEERQCRDWVDKGWGLFRVEKLFKKGLSKEVFEGLPILEDIQGVGKLISLYPGYEQYAGGPEEQVIRFLFASESETRTLADVFFDPLITMREPAPPRSRSGFQPPKDHKILIVDDDLYSAELLKHILKTLGRCETAPNGAAALEKFISAWDSADRFHLVVLDLMMPVMDGQAVLEAIRLFEEQKGLFGLDRTIVVMNTANGDINQVKKSFRLQADGYLIKPFNIESLKMQINEMKRRFLTA